MFVGWLIFFLAMIGSETPFNHYSLLKTVADIFGLDHLGYAGQQGLLGFFDCTSDVAIQAAARPVSCKKD